MSILKNILLITLLFLNINTKEQVTGSNLVNNPSFEDYYNCPVTNAELFEAKYWWGYSCEYLNTCGSTFPINVSVPFNFAGFQYAHTGNAYAGFGINSTNVIINPPDYRESIKTQLNNSLIPKQRYCTKYYVSLAELPFTYNYYIFLDSIGILFTNNPVQDSVIPIISNGIKVQNSIINLDTINWFQISNSFIANGGEKYLTIGNLENNANYPPGSTVETYIYLDDVSVCECSFKFNLGNDTTLCIGESQILNPNMPNAIYTWQDGTHSSTYTVTHAGTYYVSAYFADYNITTYDTINISYYPSLLVNLGNDTTLCSGQSLILNDTNQNYIYLWQDSTTAKTDTITQQGIYWLKVTDNNNCTASDTINIVYKDCDTTDNIISIYPNPTTDNLTIETNFNEEHRLEIINLLGQTIYTTYIGRKRIINISNYASGLYFLKIYTDKEIVVRKFIKE